MWHNMEVMANIMGSPEWIEGTKAFLDKSTPEFHKVPRDNQRKRRDTLGKA